MNTLKVKGRADWAGYIVKGDRSGLTKEAVRDADEWFAAILETTPVNGPVAITAATKPVVEKFNGKTTKIRTYTVQILPKKNQETKAIIAALTAVGNHRLAKAIKKALFQEPEDLYDAAVEFAAYKNAEPTTPAFADAVAEYVTRARADDITKNLAMKMLRREYSKAFLPARAAKVTKQAFDPDAAFKNFLDALKTDYHEARYIADDIAEWMKSRGFEPDFEKYKWTKDQFKNWIKSAEEAEDYSDNNPY